VTATILIIDDDRELRALLRRSRGGSADAADTQLLVGRTRLDSADRSATFGGTDLQRIERETERLEQLIGQLLASQGGDHYLIWVKDHGGRIWAANTDTGLAVAISLPCRPQ